MSAALGSCVGAHAYLATVLDPGSFESWDVPAVPPASADAGYRAQLDRAAAQTGTDESIVTGEGTAGGERLALVCSEFGFLAGSVGAAAAGRIVTAVARATAAGLPLLLGPASGGTRMQEGTPAFLSMVTITDRVAAHRRAGLPVVVHLRHPTTGGALASWGSLGTVTYAEPGALIGFLGPRVYRALYDEPFPAGVQVAEHLERRGLVDGVATAGELADLLPRLLTLTRHRSRPTPAPPAAPPPEQRSPDVWASITATRRPDRPGLRELVASSTVETLELHGDGAGGRATATRLFLARFSGAGCVLVGQDRAAAQPPGPDDLRVARRGLTVARELGLPLVTVIDTAGAALSAAAESGGLASQIAHCLAELDDLPVPTVSLLLGQGGGGAALALLPADRILAARHAWLTALPPEGAAAILHGSTARAPEVVAAQHVLSTDLARHGVVDRILDERPDAADEPDAFVDRVARALAEEIPLAASGGGCRLARRSLPTG